MKQIISLLICFLISIQGFSANRFVPKSDLIYKVLNIVNHLYVDNKRIRPVKMLEGSLERMSVNIAPVLTKLEVKGGKVEIDVRIDQFSRGFSFDSPKDINELNYILQQVVAFVKQYLEKDEKPETVDYAVINGFLRQLDPHSSLLIPEVYSDFSTQTSGNFGGVGMMISIRDGALTIISPIDNTPASRAGLRANDQIVQINEESTINMSLSDAVKKLRGKAGTEVDIYIMRKGFSSPKKITIIRDIIEITSVKSHQFEKDGKRVGFLKINTFQQNTIDEINEQLEDLDYDLKDFQGLIIDLRNNPGGLLEQAIKVSDRFLSDGVIVSTAGLNPGSVKSYSAHWFRSLTDIPIIILINNGSASASEIVTAALKKNNRAVVLGIQTFGKGSVQQVIPFPGGSALRITTSKYLTPGKVSIQSVGVSPHIALNPYYISNDFLHVTSPKLDKGEKSLEQAFSEWGDVGEPPQKSAFYLYENEDAEDEDDDTPNDLTHKELEFSRLQEDYLVQTAINILLENNRKSFNQLLKKSLEFIDKEQIRQEQKLIDKFASFSTKVDWNKYNNINERGKISSKSWIEIKRKVGEDKEVWEKYEGVVPAESEVRLYLEAKNIGSTEIPRLLAISNSENQLLDERQFAFGLLKPGETKRWFAPIKVSDSTPSRNNLIEFIFTDQTKKEIHKTEFVLETVEKRRPEFLYTISIIDDGSFESQGNGNGVIEINESIAVKVDIVNKGKGESGSLTALLKNGEGKNIYLNAGRQSLKALKPGESSSAYFRFDLKSLPADEDLDFSLDIIDSIFTLSSVNQKIKFALQKRVAALSNMPPSIETLSPLTSKQKEFQVDVNIIDQNGVKDVYVFNNNKKIFYKNFLSQNNRTKVDFDLNLELEEANNRVVIISRDDENVISQKNLYVRRTAFK